MNTNEFKLNRVTPEFFDDMQKIFKEEYGHKIDTNRIAENLQDYPSVTIWHQSHLIGFCYFFRFAPDIVEMANIFISSNYRNKALGGLMLDRLEECMPDSINGIIAVNTPSIKHTPSTPKNFYLKNNFQIVGETDRTTIFFKSLK